MSAPQKMLIVTLKSTQAVMGAVTRTVSGVPPVGDLLGDGLYARFAAKEAGVLVPTGELEIKEVDFADGPFRNPLDYTLDASGTIITPPQGLNATQTQVISTKATVVVNPLAGPVPADKKIFVIVDAGPNQDALKFFGKTSLNAASTEILLSGVPGGSRAVLVSVEGYGALVTTIP